MKQLKKVLITILTVMLVIYALVMIDRGVWEYTAQKGNVSDVQFTSFLTTGLDKASRPKNNIQESTLDSDIIFLYVTWENIKKQRYVQKSIFYDSYGKVLSEHDNQFKPDSSRWNTWIYYKPNHLTDRAGKWKIENYLNGELLETKYLEMKKATKSH